MNKPTLSNKIFAPYSAYGFVNYYGYMRMARPHIERLLTNWAEAKRELGLPAQLQSPFFKIPH